MKNLVFAAAVSSLALAGAARATTYTGDFSSTTLDPSLTVYQGASYITSGGGKMTFAYRPDEAGQDIAPGVYTNFLVSGDYTATIDLDMTNIPVTTQGDYYGAGFCSTPQATGNGTCIGAFNAAGTPLANGSITLNGVFSSGPVVSGGNNLTLRLQRLGDVVTESMAINGGDYETLATYSGTDVTGDTVFSFFNVSNATDGATGSVSFSNFSVVASDVPETAPWAMMIGGFGLVGSAMRRKKATVSFA